MQAIRVRSFLQRLRHQGRSRVLNNRHQAGGNCCGDERSDSGGGDGGLRALASVEVFASWAKIEGGNACLSA